VTGGVLKAIKPTSKRIPREKERTGEAADFIDTMSFFT
jgi:hypothetical protein